VFEIKEEQLSREELSRYATENEERLSKKE